jgi:hypothetical protein
MLLISRCHLNCIYPRRELVYYCNLVLLLTIFIVHIRSK